MQLEPDAFLKPLVERWPLTSASGEGLLVRAEGDSLVFLVGPAGPLGATLRQPLNAPDLPAAIAAREKHPGTTHGTDYRGFPVLAAYRPVAGTEWLLIAKVDRSEALAPARTLAYWMGMVTLFAMLVVGAALMLLMRQLALNQRIALQLQSTQIFRHFYNLPFIGMAITSPATRIWEQFNDRLCDILGYSREELAHKTWTEITHPDDLGKDVTEYERVLRGDSEGYAMEKRFIRKDGGVVFAEIDVKCVRKPDGAVDFFVATVADITGNKQAIDQLRASEERFRLIYDSSQDGILLTAPEGRIFAANPAACRMFGRTEAELCAGGRQLITDMSDSRLPAAIVERDRTGVFSGELNMLRSDGTKFPAEISTAVFQDRNRETRTSMIIRDISERKRAEMALRQSERQFRSMVEQSVAGFYVVQDGKFAYVNQRLADILGYDSIPDLLGRDILSFIPEEQRDTVAGYIREVLADEAPRSGYTVQAIRKDGIVIEIGANAAPVNIAGETSIMGLMQDISEKRRSEEQIQRYIGQLKTAFMRTVEVAMNLSEMRDPYTAGHEKRVAEIAVAIGTEMGYDERHLEGLRVAGYLHDIGKITVPAEILARPGKLSATEFALIKQHPQAGYEVLKNVEFPWPVALCVLQHHERVDGSGYPQGLKGNEICEEARILAIADTIEAMSSHRPYRPGLGLDKALSEIERGRGTAYDNEAADAALRLFRDKGYSIPS